MCPCHVDWNVMKSKPNVANPKRIRLKLRYKPDNNSTSATTPDILPYKRITVGSLLTEGTNFIVEDLLTVSQSLLEKSDETKKRPASQLDILDSSKRMKHQLEPIATTILDIFDNSDSELSDLSLHSSLLNSPISPGTPLEAVGGKPKMNESKSSNSRKPKAALKEIHVPLINPFFLKSNSYHSKDATLDSDLALIKSS
ncbi:hypothetical protein HDV02_000408 [Globomyces sp. JEL0801]|nr:hypothetical protein HDV02_000408 [Globomyces sp. JEL0801]